MPTFDGDNLLITLDSGVTEVSAKVDLYSDWKEWVKLPGNAKYSRAFFTIGGDPTTLTQAVSPYFQLNNGEGWRIKPPEEDISIVIEGNLYPKDPANDMIVPTTGGFTALIQIERSSSSLTSASGNPATIALLQDVLALVVGLYGKG